jgi:hypothetical protein
MTQRAAVHVVSVRSQQSAAAGRPWTQAGAEREAGSQSAAYPEYALSREGDPDSAMHQVASSTCGPERSQVRVLPASDRVTGIPLFHAGLQSEKGSL